VLARRAAADYDDVVVAVHRAPSAVPPISRATM
jgi:hypothetical protein